VCCGYHGWQDWYIGSTTFNRGVPKDVQQLTLPFEYNSIKSLQRIFSEHSGQVAGVILEPVGIVAPESGFLQEVHTLCHREGSLLIFDEVITGFRLARGGAQEYFGVVPDLACFGKAVANGYPLSAVVGPSEIMKTFEETFFSFTFGGEALSLAAAQATMTEILEERESLLIKSLFQQECLKRGVLFSASHNLCFSHSDEDIDSTLRVYRAAMEIVGDAIRKDKVSEYLKGEPVKPVFRKA
jgi:glutamate-1-semialdehyde 2,1-aminomutase/spore coat polysaccharide biosynthesis protein SpsF